MKQAMGICLGILIGCLGTYVAMGKGFSTASQLAYETSLSNDINAIQILEEHGEDALRDVLMMRLSCSADVYENHLGSIFWERSAYSEKLLENLEQYSAVVSCEG